MAPFTRERSREDRGVLLWSATRCCLTPPPGWVSPQPASAPGGGQQNLSRGMGGRSLACFRDTQDSWLSVLVRQLFFLLKMINGWGNFANENNGNAYSCFSCTWWLPAFSLSGFPPQIPFYLLTEVGTWHVTAVLSGPPITPSLPNPRVFQCASPVGSLLCHLVLHKHATVQKSNRLLQKFLVPLVSYIKTAQEIKNIFKRVTLPPDFPQFSFLTNLKCQTLNTYRRHLLTHPWGFSCLLLFLVSETNLSFMASCWAPSSTCFEAIGGLLF